jgi:hypothetical protein
MDVFKAARERVAFALVQPAPRGQPPEPCMRRRWTRQAAGVRPAAAAAHGAAFCDVQLGASVHEGKLAAFTRPVACDRIIARSPCTFSVLAVRGGGAAGGAAGGLQVGAHGEGDAQRAVDIVPRVAAAHPVRTGQAALAAGQRQHFRWCRGHQLPHASRAASERATTLAMLAEPGRPAGRGERLIAALTMVIEI